MGKYIGLVVILLLMGCKDTVTKKELNSISCKDKEECRDDCAKLKTLFDINVSDCQKSCSK